MDGTPFLMNVRICIKGVQKVLTYLDLKAELGNKNVGLTTYEYMFRNY